MGTPVWRLLLRPTHGLQGVFADRARNIRRENHLHWGRAANLTIRLVQDMTKPFAQSRAAYQRKMERLGVDFGLATLIATSEGMLFGRGLIADLKRIDHQLVEIRRLL